MKDVIMGLRVLRHLGGTSVCARHDIIYAEGPPPEDLTPEHRARLDKHGWYWDASLPSWYTHT